MRITLLFLLITACLIGWSQNYIPLPTENTEWIIEFEIVDGEGGPSSFGKDRQFISGDTIVNDTLFFEISVEYNWGIEKIGYIFQDTIQQKVFFTQLYWKHDELLYDFNMEIGEYSDFGMYGHLMQLVSIDSIEINNTYRKKLNFGNYIRVGDFHDKFSIIEGVGSNAGLIPMDYLGMITSYLTCFKKENEEIYPIEINEFGCDLNTVSLVGIDKVNQQNIEIYPNPFTDFININMRISNNEYALLKIFDIHGNLIYVGKIEEINHLDLTFLNNGIYLFKIEVDNQELISRTFLKL